MPVVTDGHAAVVPGSRHQRCAQLCGEAPVAFSLLHHQAAAAGRQSSGARGGVEQVDLRSWSWSEPPLHHRFTTGSRHSSFCQLALPTGSPLSSQVHCRVCCRVRRRVGTGRHQRRPSQTPQHGCPAGLSYVWVCISGERAQRSEMAHGRSWMARGRVSWLAAAMLESLRSLGKRAHM